MSQLSGSRRREKHQCLTAIPGVREALRQKHYSRFKFGSYCSVKPGESVEAVLTASRGVMKVRIVYLAHLTGSTAVNYNPTYKDHHFGSSHYRCYGCCKPLNYQEFTEDIEIGYYSDAKIELRDPTGQLKATFLAANKPAIEKIAVKAV